MRLGLRTRLLGGNSGGGALVAVAGDIISVNVLGPGSLDSAANNVTDGNGWIAEVTCKGMVTGGSTINPLYLSLTVSTPGYDTSGNATSRTRTVYGIQWLRKPYPAGTSAVGVRYEKTSGSDCKQYITLSSKIRSGETITGVSVLAGFYNDGTRSSNASNGLTTTSTASTRPENRVKMFPLTPPWQLVQSTSLVVELIITHTGFQDGYMVPYVLVTAKDNAGHTATGLASPVSDSVLRNGKGNPTPCYRATVDISGLTDGMCYWYAEARPWRGGASQIFSMQSNGFGATSWNATSYQTTQPPLHYNCPASIPFYKDAAVALAPVYACVTTTGNDGTGVADTNAATARATPFATQMAAVRAIQTKNNALYGRNDTGGGIVYMGPGTWTTWGTSTAQLRGPMWVTITRDPTTTTSAADVIIQGGASHRGTPNRVRIGEVTLKGVASNFVIANGESLTTWGGGFQAEIDFDGTVFDASGLGGAGGLLSRAGRLTFRNCTIPNLGQFGMGNSNAKCFPVYIAFSNLTSSTVETPHLWGNTGSNSFPGANANVIQYTTAGDWTLKASGLDLPPDYSIWIANKNLSQSTNPWTANGQPHGIAAYQNILEPIGGSYKGMQINSDGFWPSQTEIELGFNTIPGEAVNFLYSEYSYAPVVATNGFSTVNLSTTVTITTTANHNLITGQLITHFLAGNPTIGGITQANWGGARAITVLTATTYTFVAGAAGNGGSGGTGMSCITNGDATNSYVFKEGQIIGDCGGDFNVKGDWYVPGNGHVEDWAKMGSFAARYWVDQHSRAILGVTNAPTTNTGGGSPNDLVGEIFKDGSYVLPAALQSCTHGTISFASDKSAGSGDGLGGGDYTPGTTSSTKGKIELAAGGFGVRVPYLTDLSGASRRLDATGHVGALEGAV